MCHGENDFCLKTEMNSRAKLPLQIDPSCEFLSDILNMGIYGDPPAWTKLFNARDFDPGSCSPLENG